MSGAAHDAVVPAGSGCPLLSCSLGTNRGRTGLFDSDKLDAIGAIGIARTFMLSGQYGQRMESGKSIGEYMDDNTVECGRIKDVSKHTPLIEYEVKLRKIPDKLYTEKAREIGNDRIKFMDEFFNRLKAEMV
jgi:uncharacterized protein